MKIYNENEEIVKRCKSYGEWIKNNMNSSRELRQEKIHEFLDSYNPCKTKHISHVSENLDNNLKEIVKRGAACTNLFILSRFQAINNSALQKLTRDHGVKLRSYSDELLKAVGARASDVLPQIASKSTDGKALYNHVVSIRESMLDWSTYSEASFLEARKAAKFKSI